MSRRPGACDWRRVSLHSLTYARLYASGWWCDRHTPRWQKGLPDLPLPPPVDDQPPPTEVAAPTSTEHGQDPT